MPETAPDPRWDDHAAIVRFLSDPGAFAALGLDGPVDRIETHGARVFLIGDRAFKIKKPIAFAYMDFSTLERRAEALSNELELNRRTAPDLYLGLRRIARAADGSLAIDGPGAPVEWLLEMRRFPGDQVLDAVADRGALDRALVERAAEALGRFHSAQARPRPKGGGAANIARVLDTTERELRASIGRPFEREAIETYLDRSRAALARVAGLLDARRGQGHVRQCHGDLHLGNLVRIGDAVVPFDCIEFNDDFARIDVLYDLAFLIMDLWHRGLRGHANAALNRYLAVCAPTDLAHHLDAMAAMPLFLSARAGVRAHVLARQGRGSAASAFLADAIAFLDPAPAPVLAIGGLQGTGKSTLARSLAPDLGRPPGAVVLRSDALRKALAGVAPETRLSADHYTADWSARTYDALFDLGARAHRAGQALILDAVFYRAEERRRAEAIGAPAQGLWLDVDPEVARARLGARVGDASDADAAVFDQQRAQDPGPIAWRRLDASGAPDDLARAARLALTGLSPRITIA